MNFRDEDDTTTVEGVFLHEGNMAVLIEVDNEEVWIPKSCCDDAWDGLDRGDPITLEVATWFAEKKGL
jgi:hypothetical protein